MPFLSTTMPVADGDDDDDDKNSESDIAEYLVEMEMD